MKKFNLALTIALSVMLASCNNSVQQNEEKEDKGAPEATSISQLQTAESLAIYGYDNKSALALANAADIILSIPPVETTVMKEQSEGDAATENAEKQEKNYNFSPTALLNAAKEYAADDEAMLSVIAQIAKKDDGTRRGVEALCDRVYANKTDVYTKTFRAGAKAEILVIGDGDTDLDLYIYDENGNLIASDTDYSDRCYISFYPRWTGSFTIKIKNRGNVYNNYCIAVQ